MKFRFCGDADCPDWVLAEINTLSRLSSVKVKQLGQLVVQGITNPPFNMEKVEKLLSDSKLDLKACVACLSFIITSAIRFSCDQNALHSELQQLGLPREHSTSIKRIAVDNSEELTAKFRLDSLKVNRLEDAMVKVDHNNGCVVADLKINGVDESVILSPHTVDVLISELKQIRTTMAELHSNSFAFT